MRFVSNAFATLGLAVLATAAVAQELPADPRLNGFVPIGDYVVQIGGKPVAADVYHSQTAGSAILVKAASLPQPVVILPRERAVKGVPVAKVVTREDGSVDVISGAELTDHGTFAVNGNAVSFQVGSQRVALEEKPWLLGWHDTADMLDYSAGYAYKARTYQPSSPMVRQIAAVDQPVKVRVYFGSWCPHCKENVPKLLRLAEDLKGSKVEFEYYGLPSPFGDEPQARKEGITAVPSAIVYKNGKEVGRLAAGDWRIPELALKKLIAGG